MRSRVVIYSWIKGTGLANLSRSNLCRGNSHQAVNNIWRGKWTFSAHTINTHGWTLREDLLSPLNLSQRGRLFQFPLVACQHHFNSGPHTFRASFAPGSSPCSVLCIVHLLICDLFDLHESQLLLGRAMLTLYG